MRFSMKKSVTRLSRIFLISSTDDDPGKKGYVCLSSLFSCKKKAART